MNTPSVPSNRRSLPALCSLVLVLVGAIGCQDPFKLTARRANLDVVVEAWALTGAPPAYPSGFLVPQTTVVRLDAAGSFDLAFDINAAGKLVVLPVASVISPLAGVRPIGFQRSTAAFNTIAEAPKAGWTNDTALVVIPGEIFLVKVFTQFCQFDLRKDIYAKFIVDSVLPIERRIKLTGFVNPNCGFRSFQTGVPEF